MPLLLKVRKEAEQNFLGKQFLNYFFSQILVEYSIHFTLQLYNLHHQAGQNFLVNVPELLL